MRFIFNFILYGVIFYAIWVFFPDAFHTLVTWADKTFEVIRGLVNQILERWNLTTPGTGTPPTEAPKALWMALTALFF